MNNALNAQTVSAVGTKGKNEMKKGSDTTRSREVTQPSTDVARDCLISRFGMELDVSSRVWPLRHIGLIVLYDIIGLVAGNLPI